MKKLKNGIEVDLTQKEISEFNDRLLNREDKYIDSYKVERENEYPTITELIISLWEKVVESRPESADTLEIKRQSIKTKYPKRHKNV